MKPFYRYSFKSWEVIQTPTLWQSYQGYNYMVAKDGKAFLFDPGEQGPIVKTLKACQLEVEGIYLTHHHQDHVGAVLTLKEDWNCPVFGFAGDRHRLPGVTDFFTEGDTLTIADLPAQVLFLPGHTVGLCAFYFAKMNWLFSSDLLFSLGCGRIFEGTPQQMFASLNQVRALPDETLIFSSHEYTETNLKFGLSQFKDDPQLLNIQKDLNEKFENQTPTVPMKLGFEKRNNPFLRWDDPLLRQKLKMETSEDWQVFTKIRTLRNTF